MFISEIYLKEFVGRLVKGVKNFTKPFRQIGKLNKRIRATKNTHQDRGTGLKRMWKHGFGDEKRTAAKIDRMRRARSHAYIDATKKVGKGGAVAGGVGLVGKSYNDAKRERETSQFR